jgi:lipopolysaccharide/colanic/teichoic acid biosynthesis glycosyltransferase
MNIICSKQKFLDIVEHERARSDRTGDCFSVITFHISTLNKHESEKTAFGDLFIKNTRRYDDIGFLENNCFAILSPRISCEQAHKVAHRFCSAIIPENLNPTSTVFTYPSTGESGKQDDAQHTAADASKTISHMAAWANTYGNFIQQLKMPTTQMPPWKRIMDIIGAAAGLILVLPVCMLLAAYIKSVSPGPAVFTQRRVGYRGKTFMCFKFRTMHINATTSVHKNYFKKLMASETPMEKLDNYDPRIIPYGRLLRKSGLDELPQLLNVLFGDMSLIGPRPCIPYEAEQYKQWQLKRFESVPGITGLWQVNGKNKTTFNAMMRYDIRYALKKDIIKDTAILLKTIPAVIRMVMEDKTVKAERLANEKEYALEE